MCKNSGKCLLLLLAFSVAVPLNPARAQTEPSSPNPGSSQQEPGSGCASGDIAACQGSQPSQGTPGEAAGGSSWAFPALNAGAPNPPMSVYRDDAGNIDRSNESRQHPNTPIPPQPLSEFQMLVAGSVGRIVPVYGAELFANVPDTFAPVQPEAHRIIAITFAREERSATAGHVD